MTQPPATDDAALVTRIRRQDPGAWEQLIGKYQGRLLAFARQRVGDEAAAEDVVQETFLGFLIALPNYDPRTPLEAFLFAICAHKLIDALRKQGRRPRLLPTLVAPDSNVAETYEPPSRDRRVSSLARSHERKVIAERVLGDCLKQLVQTWLSRAEFERLMCLELLLVSGEPNKDAAVRLGISEQTVANHKSFVLQKLKAAAQAAGLRDDEWCD
jgi:RNA polymerase sigma-70 factor (ECF subfamily)